MKDYLVILLFTLYSLSSIGQEYNEKGDKDLKTDYRLAFYGLSNPEGANGEVFKNLKIDYQISERMTLQLQHFYEKFGTNEGTNSSFLMNWYLKENLYFFSGPEYEYDTNQATGKFELERVNLNLGVGYDVNPNLLLELNYHVRMNKATLEPFGNQAILNTFSLRASF